MLENMADERVDQDLFEEFLSCYLRVFTALRSATKDQIVTKEFLEDAGLNPDATPFGTSVFKVFSTSQALTGFGSAIARMKDYGVISSFDDVTKDLEKIKNADDMIWFAKLLERLDKIKTSAKKIGNAQRMFFQYFFRELLNADSDSYMDLTEAVENGYKKYYSQVS